MSEHLSKSEEAFEAWYKKQKAWPMPSDCWDAAVEFVLKYAREHGEDDEDLEELTK